MTHAIQTSGVHVHIGAAHILRGVDFELATGRTLAVLGSNGSGKSTLIRALVGIIPTSHGTIRLLGHDITQRSRLPWANIGYAPQRITATSGVPATALETVMAGLIYGRRMRPGRGARTQALEALDMVGLAHRATDAVHTFSGGQQQRILTARALVRKPDLLILDEPFAGVDDTSRESIRRVLHREQERGTTIVLVLHEIQEHLALLHEALVLDAGRVLEHTSDLSRIAGRTGHNHPGHDHLHPHSDPRQDMHISQERGLL
ncbi:metal ABC transporter ATP-binding protein [Trueperella sp. LYQ143]|uniref:metal ABC transporter ATP-binding protein n=1 Tax=unclassified Trueperella TaxID=2630174 RepID=UPI0039833107